MGLPSNIATGWAMRLDAAMPEWLGVLRWNGGFGRG